MKQRTKKKKKKKKKKKIYIVLYCRILEFLKHLDG